MKLFLRKSVKKACYKAAFSFEFIRTDIHTEGYEKTFIGAKSRCFVLHLSVTGSVFSHVQLKECR